MMADLGSEAITFTAEAATDMYGDPIAGTALSGAVEGCAVYPVSTSESSDIRYCSPFWSRTFGCVWPSTR